MLLLSASMLASLWLAKGNQNAVKGRVQYVPPYLFLDLTRIWRKSSTNDDKFGLHWQCSLRLKTFVPMSSNFAVGILLVMHEKLEARRDWVACLNVTSFLHENLNHVHVDVLKPCSGVAFSKTSQDLIRTNKAHETQHQYQEFSGWHH